MSWSYVTPVHPACLISQFQSLCQAKNINYKMHFIFDAFDWLQVLGIIEERIFFRRFDKHNSRDPKIPPPKKIKSRSLKITCTRRLTWWPHILKWPMNLNNIRLFYPMYKKKYVCFVCKGKMCSNYVENTRRHCSKCSCLCDQLPKICSPLHCSCLIQNE